MGGHFLLQGIFLTQGSNSRLLPCRQILYHLSHQGEALGGGGCLKHDFQAHRVKAQAASPFPLWRGQPCKWATAAASLNRGLFDSPGSNLSSKRGRG